MCVLLTGIPKRTGNVSMIMPSRANLTRFPPALFVNTTVICRKLLRITCHPLEPEARITQRYAYGFGESHVLVSLHLLGLVTTTLSLVTSGGMATKAKSM